jgi:hypothetical protein
MIINLEIFWRHFIDGVGVDKLEEWIAASMSADAASEVVKPAASFDKKNRHSQIHTRAPAVDDRTA